MRLFSTIMMAALLMSAPVMSAHAGQHGKMSQVQTQSVQQALADAGYYRAGVDGRWGPYSVQALKSFQYDKGLPVTGKLDAETYKRLGVRVAKEYQKR